jgi:cytidine deaminase
MLVAKAREAALAPEIQSLYTVAEEARDRAYAPYSDFRVGAAVSTRDGSVISGGNVENASYGLTICAERAAIFRALAEGHDEFAAVAVAGPAQTVSPCGACRQVLAEFLAPEVPIIFPVDGEVLAVPLGVLLPHAFGPDNVRSGS